MKKIAIITLVLILLVAMSGCSLAYNYAESKDKTWTYGVSRKDAFVICHQWDGKEENKRIVIPDEFDNVPVTRLGGYHGRGVPSPFSIRLPEAYDNDNTLIVSDKFFQNQQAIAAWFPNGYEIVEITFTLCLGKNVNSLYYHETCYYQFTEQGKKTILYLPVFRFECAEENETFYAKDGVLYEKATDKVIEWEIS